MDLPHHRRISIPGMIGVICIAFIWLARLLPRSSTALKPVLNGLGPLQALVVLARVVMPVIAAIRGSKWWLVVAAAGATTMIALLIQANQ
jgi:hypothetical protein